MEYVTYREESDMVPYDKYRLIKQAIEQRDPKVKKETYNVRKLRFSGIKTQETVPDYSICVKDQDQDQIYLEKKYRQGGIYHKQLYHLSRTEYDRILKGDLDWMRAKDDKIMTEFYLQLVLNHFSPISVTEYKGVQIVGKKEGQITFYKSIKRAVGGRRDLFTKPDMVISCLDEDKVMVSYKKAVKLPDIIMNMMHLQDDANEETAEQPLLV